MQDKITINGVEYAPVVDPTDHICVIASNGWIFAGYRVPSDDGVKLTDASVVRSWANGRGIGGFANAAYKDEYTLDEAGVVTVIDVVAIIELGW